MAKILAITGATGKKSGNSFIEIIKNNYDYIKKEFPDGVRLIIRDVSKKGDLLKQLPYADIQIGDFSDLFLQNALTNVDTVVHVAGIHNSCKIIDASVSNGIRRLILVHTTGIYSKYKEAGEEYRRVDAYCKDKCQSNNILLTILRPTMIYGNKYDQNIIKFIKMVDKLPFMPIVNDANYDLQPVHYKDLANAYFQVLKNETKTANRDFILSGKNPISLRRILMVIAQKLNKKIRFISVPYSIAYPGSVFIYYLSLKKIDYREKVQRLCEPRAYPHDDAFNCFGYNPRSFEEGISDEIKEYLEK